MRKAAFDKHLIFFALLSAIRNFREFFYSLSVHGEKRGEGGGTATGLADDMVTVRKPARPLSFPKKNEVPRKPKNREKADSTPDFDSGSV
jgi:hypothetical protein